MLRRAFAFLAAAASARADEAFRIYDAGEVRAIFDITNSGVGLAVQDLAKARDRIVIFGSTSSSDLTGKACSPNGIQWNPANWSNGVALITRLPTAQRFGGFIGAALASRATIFGSGLATFTLSPVWVDSSGLSTSRSASKRPDSICTLFPRLRPTTTGFKTTLSSVSSAATSMPLAPKTSAVSGTVSVFGSAGMWK